MSNQALSLPSLLFSLSTSYPPFVFLHIITPPPAPESFPTNLINYFPNTLPRSWPHLSFFASHFPFSSNLNIDLSITLNLPLSPALPTSLHISPGDTTGKQIIVSFGFCCFHSYNYIMFTFHYFQQNVHPSSSPFSAKIKLEILDFSISCILGQSVQVYIRNVLDCI